MRCDNSNLVISMITCAILWFTGTALAGSTDNHQVTVMVDPINEVSISGGNVTLTIDTATAGYNPNAVVDNVDPCILYWTTNESGKKITVSTSLVSPKFSLYLTSHNITGGQYIGAVLLTTTAANYILNISKTTGHCDLQYLAMARANQGTGTDVHTSVTFTLTDN